MMDTLPPEITEDRRKDSTTKAFKAIHNQLQEHHALIRENTKVIGDIHTNTAEIIDAFTSGKNAFKVLNWLGALAKPIGYIVVLASSAYAFFSAIKGGGHIELPK